MGLAGTRGAPQDHARFHCFAGRQGLCCREGLGVAADKEIAETADAGQHFGAHRPLSERFDPLDQRVPGVDVDAGIAVRQRGRFSGGGRRHQGRRERAGPGITAARQIG